MAIKQLSLERLPSESLQVRPGSQGTKPRPLGAGTRIAQTVCLRRRPRHATLLAYGYMASPLSWLLPPRLHCLPCYVLPCLQGIMSSLQLLRSLNRLASSLLACRALPCLCLQGIMNEVELLRNLNHRNIVKYIGSLKSKTHLYIILEFMENGALRWGL